MSQKNVLLGSVGMALAIGLLLGPVSAEAAAGEKTFISIGTGGPSGTYFAVGNAICRLIDKEAAEGRKTGRDKGIRCSAPSSAGSIYNIENVRSGEFDFGVSQSDWQYHAYHGTSKFEGRQFKKIRALFSVYPEPVHLIIRDGVDAKEWEDLKGKVVNVGNPGSGHNATVTYLIEESGWDLKKDFKLATNLSTSEEGGAMCDGKIDAVISSTGFPGAFISMMTDGCKARLIPFKNAVAERILKKNPYYSWVTIPKGTYSTMKEDIVTFGPRATLITSADEPDWVVYEVVRAVFENLEDFRNLHPAFKTLKEKEMVTEALTAPIHPGAMKYYKEKGLM